MTSKFFTWNEFISVQKRKRITFFFRNGGLHDPGTFFRDDAYALILSALHMHGHVTGKVRSRYLHSASWRKNRRTVTHNIVLYLISPGIIGTGRRYQGFC